MPKNGRPRTPALDDLEATYRRTVAAALTAWRTYLRIVERNNDSEADAHADFMLAMRAVDMTHKLYTTEIRRLGGR